MEVNTRIQVEHTVTEELTGVDLVKAQILIAQGEKLTLKQSDIQFKGHVMQFRINAENPNNNFSPSPGKLEYYLPPGGPHVRVDSACYTGYKIPPHYDSMIAKLIVKGKDREEAMAIGRRALREFHINGVESTIPFHLWMLDNPDFNASQYDLNYTDAILSKGITFTPPAS
jgi:acetyl-CoA carboxylase biotin carboxylase subunit